MFFIFPAAKKKYTHLHAPLSVKRLGGKVGPPWPPHLGSVSCLCLPGIGIRTPPTATASLEGGLAPNPWFVHVVLGTRFVVVIVDLPPAVPWMGQRSGAEALFGERYPRLWLSEFA